MDNADKITLDRVTDEIKISFAKMTLEQIEAVRKAGVLNVDFAMLHEIRENAQAIAIKIF